MCELGFTRVEVELSPDATLNKLTVLSSRQILVDFFF